MSEQDAFERIIESMTDAMLDDSRWPGVAALIDEACGLTGNDILVAEGPKDDVRVLFVGAYTRGQRREDQERDYLENYHPTDERVPRFRQLPHGRLVHVTDLFTPDELKTSPTYNEMLLRDGGQNSMYVRLDGPDGSSIAWGLRDPVDSDDWGASRIRMVTRLLPQSPAVRPRPAGTVPRRGAEQHDHGRPPPEPSDWRRPPGPARPDNWRSTTAPSVSCATATDCGTGRVC